MMYIELILNKTRNKSAFNWKCICYQIFISWKLWIHGEFIVYVNKPATEIDNTLSKILNKFQTDRLIFESYQIHWVQFLLQTMSTTSKCSTLLVSFLFNMWTVLRSLLVKLWMIKLMSYVFWVERTGMFLTWQLHIYNTR